MSLDHPELWHVIYESLDSSGRRTHCREHIRVTGFTEWDARAKVERAQAYGCLILEVRAGND